VPRTTSQGQPRKQRLDRNTNAARVALRWLPADQRELCIGLNFEYEAIERWERLARS